jgi:peptidylprolyl isomerase
MVENGSKVVLHYTGKFEDDNVFDSSIDKDPLEFVVGEGNLIPGFENGVIGMNVGDKKTIEIEAEDAYGPIKEELINTIPRENVPEGVTVGQMLQAETEQGPIIVTIRDLSEESVTVDANHPLAGKKLIFELEVLEVV